MKAASLALVGLLVVGAVLLVRERYRQTRYVGLYELVERTVDENAAAGRLAGLSPLAVGPQRGLVRRPSSGHAWLLFWGGNSGRYFERAAEVIAALALPPEVGVLVVAPSGYDSPGHPSPAQVAREAVAARDWLRTHEGAEKVVLGSFSLGCFSVFAALDAQVAGAVMVGVSEKSFANDPGPFLRLRTPHVYERAVVAPPLRAGLVIQGARDWPEDAEVVAAWLGARRVMIPDVDHEGARLHPDTLAAQRAFIVSTLQGP